MKNSLQIAGAFVGLIVGAGFASGQEIMQFFTSFGWYGIVGGIIAAFGFSLLGMNLAQLGNELHTTSHKEVIYYIAGRYFGPILDLLITIILFSLTTAMFAGSASIFEQMFGINAKIGSLFMMILTVITLMLNVRSIINVIGMATPYLLAIVFVIALYSIFTVDLSFAEMDALAKKQQSATPNWLLGSSVYVSYNIASGVAMLTVMGSSVKSRKQAGMGGIIGGVILGILILLINIAMFMRIDTVSGSDMPLLVLANEIHPVVGILGTISLLLMIYNTAVGMLYAFVVRIVSPERKLYEPAVVIIGLLGFFASFVGFTTLVGEVYSTMGYLGFAIIIAIVISRLRKR